MANSQILVTQDPSNADWQRSLLVDYGKIGDVVVVYGELPEPLDANR
jgi:hypothetical protein